MDYICGLASRDVTVEDFMKMYEMAKSRFFRSITQEGFEFYGARSLG
jgi:hypothetical protein